MLCSLVLAGQVCKICVPLIPRCTEQKILELPSNTHLVQCEDKIIVRTHMSLLRDLKTAVLGLHGKILILEG